jgi:ketosteroid isomerase-like protein
MKSKAKKPAARKTAGRKPTRVINAAAIIRNNGSEWARNWNERKLDLVVAAYAPDAVYLPPHHAAVHGRNAIRAYLQGPLTHGVAGLFFDVTYIKQQDNVAWDVGKYRMNIPQANGVLKEDHGKYLTVWKRMGTKWVIAADAWSSDLPA